MYVQFEVAVNIKTFYGSNILIDLFYAILFPTVLSVFSRYEAENKRFGYMNNTECS